MPSPGGKPCATSVVSSATTPRPSRSAGRDLLGDADHGIAPSFAQQRAAASRPSSTPPTRKPAASASPAPVGIDDLDGVGGVVHAVHPNAARHRA